MSATKTNERTGTVRRTRQMYVPYDEVVEFPIFDPNGDEFFGVAHRRKRQQERYYQDNSGNVYRLVSPEEMLVHLEAMKERDFMKYYGDLPKVDLTVTDTYTAEGAWAHTDARTIINARSRRPYHTLSHEVEHVVAAACGYSQDEHWIDFRARDPSRDSIRRNVVVRGDYN
jgi:hypothetical protein